MIRVFTNTAYIYGEITSLVFRLWAWRGVWRHCPTNRFELGFTLHTWGLRLHPAWWHVCLSWRGK